MQRFIGDLCTKELVFTVTRPSCTQLLELPLMLYRYLHKLYSQKQLQSQLPTDVMYLASDYPRHKTCAARTPHQLFDAHIQLEAYRQRAVRWALISLSYRIDTVAILGNICVRWNHVFPNLVANAKFLTNIAFDSFQKWSPMHWDYIYKTVFPWLPLVCLIHKIL